MRGIVHTQPDSFAAPGVDDIPEGVVVAVDMATDHMPVGVRFEHFQIGRMQTAADVEHNERVVRIGKHLESAAGVAHSGARIAC